ncbi:MAG: FMN-binding protein [Victivallales bacterium]|nr:FMN-binding protein [Victivallales bacterium]
MKEILKLTLALAFICAVAGAALAFVSQKTAAPREKARIAQRDAKMKLLLPAETNQVSELPSEGEVAFYEARNAAGEVIAYCAEGSDPNGFSGEIKVLVGFNLDGTIRGVLVSENSETPGVGSRACNRETTKSFWSLFASQKEEDTQASQLPPNAYLDSFNGQHLGGEFQFGQSSQGTAGNGVVTPVSGATVSSTAIRNAVNRVSAAARQQFHFAATQE